MSVSNHPARSIRSRVGVSIEVNSAPQILDSIAAAASAGVEQLWLGQVSESPAALTVLAAAMQRTPDVKVGTAIIPIYPLHPLALAQQAATVASLGPGRLRLGIGPSTAARMLRQFGVTMESPLAYLEEYVSILRSVLWQGSTDHHGRFLTAQITVDEPPQIPILISALGEAAFRLAGRVTDGAISWNCPPDYLLETALPAMVEGAAEADRPVPPLVAHLCVARTSDPNLALEAGRAHLAFYVRLPFYAAMFAAAGFPIPADGSVPDALVTSMVLYGTDDEIARRMTDLLDAGLDELLITDLAVGPNPDETGLFRLVGGL